MLLHDAPVSSNALKVRFLLEELGLAYERREVPLSRPRPDWHVAVNPIGGIPTLIDGSLVLSESNTILRYLAGIEGRDDLYPREPAARARVDQLLDRFSLTFRPAFFKVEAEALGFVAGTGFDGRPRDPEAARRAAAEVAPTLSIMEGLLPDEGYALGAFSIADCSLAPALYRTTNTRMDSGALPPHAAPARRAHGAARLLRGHARALGG